MLLTIKGSEQKIKEAKRYLKFYLKANNLEIVKDETPKQDEFLEVIEKLTEENDTLKQENEKLKARKKPGPKKS